MVSLTLLRAVRYTLNLNRPIIQSRIARITAIAVTVLLLLAATGLIVYRQSPGYKDKVHRAGIEALDQRMYDNVIARAARRGDDPKDGYDLESRIPEDVSREEFNEIAKLIFRRLYDDPALYDGLPVDMWFVDESPLAAELESAGFKVLSADQRSKYRQAKAREDDAVADLGFSLLDIAPDGGYVACLEMFWAQGKCGTLYTYLVQLNPNGAGSYSMRFDENYIGRASALAH